MKRSLIRGHNGLRNRIAERLGVANMVELVPEFSNTLISTSFIFHLYFLSLINKKINFSFGMISWLKWPKNM